MKTRFLAFSIILTSLFITPAMAGIEGSWNLKLKPKLVVSVYGAPVDGIPFKVPTTDQITFKLDPGFQNSGSFTSGLYSGTWAQNKTSFKGTPTKTIVETTMHEYLAKGQIYGFTFTNGQMRKASNKLTGKILKNGTISGSFTHISTWKIRITKPQKLDAPIQVRLTTTFTGTRIPAAE